MNISHTGDGSLTFVIPIQSSRGVPAWDEAMRLLQETVRSCMNQKGAPAPTVVLGASLGDPLPELPAGVKVARVDHEWSPLPAAGEERFQAIRRDKGLRVLAALQKANPRGHVMVVDWDDLVSPHLGKHVQSNPNANGWFVETGLIFNDGPLAVRIRRGLHMIMGTSLIHRHDLMRIPEGDETVDFEWVDKIYGSHIFSVGVLEAGGTPLQPLPFDGAAYRIGTGNNVSGEDSPLRLSISRHHCRRWMIPLTLRTRRAVNAYR